MLTLLHGDCREILKTLPDQSVQCCTVLDPFGGSGTTGQVAIENSDNL
jgi:DNA modification methylase